MSDDERAIRALVDRWMELTVEGDVDGVLDLMSDDVVFSVSGQEPFGKEEFAATARQMQGLRIEGSNEIRELQILGDWAFIRNFIDIRMSPPGAEAPVHRNGYTLTLLRKEADGRWRLARDANMVSRVDHGPA
ncbi:MAG TPA: SgcJ/EcaC family oxidoreductase [Trueperaceae bacterium]